MKSSKGLYAVVALLGLCGVLVIGLIFSQRYVEDRIRVSLNEAIEKNADKVAVSYRSVKVSFLKRAVAVNGIEVTPNGSEKTFSMDRFELSDLDEASLLRMIANPHQKTVPASLRVSLQGMHFTPDLMGDKASKPLTDMGYKELKVSLSVGFKIDRQEKTFGLNDMNIDVTDVGKLSTTWQFSSVDIPSDDELAHPDTLQKSLANRWKTMALHYGDLRFDDHSLLSRIDANLKASGKPSLAESSEMLGALAAGMSRGPAGAEFLSTSIPKIQDFLAKGGSIAIKAAPAADLPLVQLANPVALTDPNAFAKQIGLSLEVTH